jgi:hypothetical protein
VCLGFLRRTCRREGHSGGQIRSSLLRKTVCQRLLRLQRRQNVSVWRPSCVKRPTRGSPTGCQPPRGDRVRRVAGLREVVVAVVVSEATKSGTSTSIASIRWRARWTSGRCCLRMAASLASVEADHSRATTAVPFGAKTGTASNNESPSTSLRTTAQPSVRTRRSIARHPSRVL